MKIKKTFTSRIYIGFKEYTGERIHSFEEARDIVLEYCKKYEVFLSLTPTTFFYPRSKAVLSGSSPGAFVELVSQPRSFRSKYDLVQISIEIAKLFIFHFKLNSVLIVTSDQSFLVDSSDLS
jgi:hypothetical protein